MTIFAAVKFNIMRQQKTIVTILLNILLHFFVLLRFQNKHHYVQFQRFD